MTRTTLNMIIQGKKLTFEAEANPGVQDDIDLLGNFESHEQAIEMFDKDIKDLTKILYGIKYGTNGTNTTTNTEKKMDTTTTKTKAIQVIMPGDLGHFWLSKEYLLATGMKIDAALIRTDKDGNILVLDISMMELAAKCSQKVRLEVENYVAKRIGEIKVSIAKPTLSDDTGRNPVPLACAYKPAKNGKKQAEDLILSNLKEKITGNWGEFLGQGKGQLIADLTGREFSEATVKEVQLTTEKGILYVHVPHNVYNTDRAKWGEVIESFRNACRKSRLEYSRPRDGKLPIGVRAAGKSQL